MLDFAGAFSAGVLPDRGVYDDFHHRVPGDRRMVGEVVRASETGDDDHYRGELARRLSSLGRLSQHAGISL